MCCHEGQIMERWWRRMYQCKSSQKRRSMCCSHRMLLQKNSAVYVTKPDELDDAWMRDSMGLWRNGCITWVPTDVRESVLSHEHDLPAAGHPGARKMKSALLKSYWWVIW